MPDDQVKMVYFDTNSICIWVSPSPGKGLPQPKELSDIFANISNLNLFNIVIEGQRVLNFTGGNQPFLLLVAEWINHNKTGNPLVDAPMLYADLMTVRDNFGKESKYDGDIRFTVNWLSTGTANETVGSGGPGADEMDATPVSSGAWKFGWLSGQPTDDATKAVAEYILDTLPTGIVGSGASPDVQATSLSTAQILQGTGPHADPGTITTPGHILNELERRISQNTFNLYPAGTKGIILPDPTLHPYSMTNSSMLPLGTINHVEDHGLFIAGIIHSLVPEPPVLQQNEKTHVPGVYLRLIQILTGNGVGTMESLAQGLIAVSQMIAGDDKDCIPVINLSLVFSTPFAAIEAAFEGLSEVALEVAKTTIDDFFGIVFGKPVSDLSTKAKQQQLREESDQAKKDLGQAVNLILGMVHTEGDLDTNIHLVAAAGNDHERSPRYPASAPNVYSVGAVAHWEKGALTAEKASYTNETKSNSTEGIWALGGDYAGITNAPTGGILGASLHEPSGYAQWAGTSFAAAITSGALAAFYAHGLTSKELNDAIKANTTQVNGVSGTLLPIEQG